MVSYDMMSYDNIVICQDKIDIWDMGYVLTSSLVSERGCQKSKKEKKKKKKNVSKSSGNQLGMPMVQLLIS